MQTYNIGNLGNWSPVVMGRLMECPLPSSGHRAISFDLICDAPVSVRAVSKDAAWLVAYGSGHMDISFKTDVEIAVVVLGHAETDCYMRTRIETQVIPESLDPSFTTIEPRPSGPNEELRRMMKIVRLNQEAREKQLRDEFNAQLQEVRAGFVVQPDKAEKAAQRAAEKAERKAAKADEKVIEDDA